MFLRLLPLVIAATFAVPDEAPKMKTIEYRGGVISFRVPAHWQEEYSTKGGGMFYDDQPQSGTLRLNVLTFKAPEGRLPIDGYHYITAKGAASGERLSRTERGDGIKFSKKLTEEEGEKLVLCTWELVHCAPPEKLYVAVFTWTTSAAQGNDAKLQKEIQSIDAEIKKACFHADLGKLGD